MGEATVAMAGSLVKWLRRGSGDAVPTKISVVLEVPRVHVVAAAAAGASARRVYRVPVDRRGRSLAHELRPHLQACRRSLEYKTLTLFYDTCL